jgi:hypothetical protein
MEWINEKSEDISCRYSYPWIKRFLRDTNNDFLIKPWYLPEEECEVLEFN